MSIDKADQALLVDEADKAATWASSSATRLSRSI
jgi:hypothetical protein